MPGLTLVLLGALAPAAVQAAPKKTSVPKVDPRVERELRRVKAAYSGLGAFSMSSLETIKLDELNQYKIYTQGRIDSSGRLAIKIEGKQGLKNADHLPIARLSNGTHWFQSIGGRPETRRTLAEVKRENPGKYRKPGDPLDDFFRQSIGLSTVLEFLRSEKLPGSQYGPHSPPIFRALGNGRTQIESQDSTPAQGAEPACVSTLIQTIGRDGFLEGLEIRELTPGEPPLVVKVALSRPTPLTMEAPFDWPSYVSSFNPNFSISPESTSAFERAAKLYGGLKSLSFDIKSETTSATRPRQVMREKGQVAWERRGLLRYEQSIDGVPFSKVVSGGKTLWLREDGVYTGMELGKGALPKSEEVLMWLNYGATPDSRDLDFGGTIRHLFYFLEGNTPLLTDLLRNSGMKAVFDSTVELEGVPCNMVKINQTTRPKDKQKPRIDHTFWFAQDDGRLLRVITTYPAERKTIDTRLENQRFNPSFAASIFKFTPPKDAISEWLQ
jgi:outer membrane lipoprotein-sorting protein